MTLAQVGTTAGSFGIKNWGAVGTSGDQDRESDLQDFRQYARENEPPPTWEDCEILHPFCRDEWHKLGKLPAKS